MNLVILNGNLCREWDIKTTPTGKQVIRSSIAVSRGDSTEFINLQAWQQTADLLIKYICKGDRFTLQGYLKTDSYKKDGQTKYYTYVVIQSFYFGYKPKHTDGIIEASDKDTAEAAMLFADYTEV